jgi:hypothetical protein
MMNDYGAYIAKTCATGKMLLHNGGRACIHLRAAVRYLDGGT